MTNTRCTIDGKKGSKYWFSIVVCGSHEVSPALSNGNRVECSSDSDSDSDDSPTVAPLAFIDKTIKFVTLNELVDFVIMFEKLSETVWEKTSPPSKPALMALQILSIQSNLGKSDAL